MMPVQEVHLCLVMQLVAVQDKVKQVMQEAVEGVLDLRLVQAVVEVHLQQELQAEEALVEATTLLQMKLEGQDLEKLVQVQIQLEVLFMAIHNLFH